MSIRNYHALLHNQWAQKKFLCVGLDPNLEKIPESIRTGDVYDTLLNFNKAIIDATLRTETKTEPKKIIDASVASTEKNEKEKVVTKENRTDGTREIPVRAVEETDDDDTWGGLPSFLRRK